MSKSQANYLDRLQQIREKYGCLKGDHISSTNYETPQRKTHDSYVKKFTEEKKNCLNNGDVLHHRMNRVNEIDKIKSSIRPYDNSGGISYSSHFSGKQNR